MKKGDLVQKTFIHEELDLKTGKPLEEIKQFIVHRMEGKNVVLMRSNRLGHHYLSTHPVKDLKMVKEA